MIVAFCALAILFSLPNMLSKEALGWLQANASYVLPTKTVNLGLDLRGGSHLLLEVAVDTIIDEKMQALLDQVRSDLRGAKVGYTDLAVANGAVRFRLTDTAQDDKAREIIRSIDRDLDVSRDDATFTLRMTDAQIRDKKRAAMDQSVEIVRRRIDETGTREPSIQRQGDNRILVQLPGVDDPEHIKHLLGQTAKLTFRLVDEAATNALAAGEGHGIVPPGTEKLPSTEVPGQFFVVQKRIMVSGDTLVDAQPSFNNAEPVVSFTFDSVGGKRFGEATRTNVGRLFAIVLDNKVISAPVIRDAILGGSGIISGRFTTQSANDLALLLRAGALPAPIKVLEERMIGPGLGADSIHDGMTASLVGLALVVVFILAVYGLFGIFAVIALMFTIAMIFGALSILQATLTLPGIAGIVLTIGTAVDANVLVFERIREEMRLGRSVNTCIDAGYRHALSAIIDANMTTLIAALLLYMFGSGPVKGFAVTLAIGIIASIFSAIMVTRLITIFWMERTKPKQIPI
jgi:preprotein translocase subunit SecD